MLTRRSLFAALCAVPFLGKIVYAISGGKKEELPTKSTRTSVEGSSYKCPHCIDSIVIFQVDASQAPYFYRPIAWTCPECNRIGKIKWTFEVEGYNRGRGGVWTHNDTCGCYGNFKSASFSLEK